MLSELRKLSFNLVLLCIILVLPWVTAVASTSVDEGVRIDMPSGGQVRIENLFGNIAAEVWKEKYVFVSATILGSSATFTRSPVVIETRNQLLSISIIRTPVDPVAAIGLTIKMPEDAHAEIVAGGGTIASRGLPLWVPLRSVSGDIRAELSPPLNADISARSENGVIRSELAAPLEAAGHLLQTRIGPGERILRISTATGQITLALGNQENNLAGNKKRPPRLIASQTVSRGAGTAAPNTETEEVSEGDVIRVDSQLVTLSMSVIDRNTNRGLVGLSQADFKLFEDGVEQKVLRFDSSSAPFDLLLLIDLSGSTRDVVKLIRAAALRFIDAARPSDRIGVTVFAGQPTLVSALTLDREILRQRVNAIDTAAGDTKLYDATDFAMNQLLKDPKNSRRTAIVLMSDGLDGTIPGVNGQQGSKLPYRELLNRIREFDGVLYTLWLNTEYESLSPLDTQPEAFDMGHDRLQELAEIGGGLFYEVERLEDLAGAYERVIADLGTVYSLEYRPLNKTRDGRWRAIRVKIDRPSAVARGKNGYYAN